VTGHGKDVGSDQMTNQQVARLVKLAVLAAGVRGDLPEGERGAKFAGHSLRASLAASAEVDKRATSRSSSATPALR
jgi:hypothetical protein